MDRKYFINKKYAPYAGAFAGNAFPHLSIHRNRMQINSIETFASINGRFAANQKDVCFLRQIGIPDSTDYQKQILHLDQVLSARKNGYDRIHMLSNALSQQDRDFYQNLYETLTPQSRCLGIRFSFTKEHFNANLVYAFYEVLRLYQAEKKGCSDSIRKNYGIKLLFWLDLYLPSLYTPDYDLAYSPKFVCCEADSLQEYLFLYLLVLTGCDVLYLNSQKDISVSEKLRSLSQKIEYPRKEAVTLPDYIPQNAQPASSNAPIRIAHPNRTTVPATASQEIFARQTTSSVRISIPPRPERGTPHPGCDTPKPSVSSSQTPPTVPFQTSTQTLLRREHSYEELARLASSVVMIGVLDQQGECFASGSGVMIAEGGYILTNFHVVEKGSSFLIRIENEEQTYQTSELIKYHPDFDLALLRIDRKCQPIPLYQNSAKLVRGQKVVAIGSPLGLFNTVSDGIISGLRETSSGPMIQFTAPISHGSSGGALLNLYGELIGLLAGGFDDGENLNVAVSYRSMAPFLSGFLPR